MSGSNGPVFIDQQPTLAGVSRLFPFGLKRTFPSTSAVTVTTFDWQFPRESAERTRTSCPYNVRYSSLLNGRIGRQESDSHAAVPTPVRQQSSLHCQPVIENLSCRPSSLAKRDAPLSSFTFFSFFNLFLVVLMDSAKFNPIAAPLPPPPPYIPSP